MTRYSREDVLTERELELLLRGAKSLTSPQDFEATLTINCAAKLGMRSGEIAHLDTNWINWHDRLIEIPHYDECTQGKDGEICGYCRNRARDYTETHDDVGFDEALERRWRPKTKTSERSVPFDFDVRVQLCLEQFEEIYDSYPRSKATLNRRIDAAAESAGLDSRIYPHSLRATAATIHASRNVSPYALMSIMGWQDMDTARSYISASGESAARELRNKYR